MIRPRVPLVAASLPLVGLSLLTGCGDADPESVDSQVTTAGPISAEGVGTEPETGVRGELVVGSKDNEPSMEHLLPCVEFDEYGYGFEQAFSFDKYSKDLELMVLRFMEIETENHDTIAGVAYCSNYDGVAVFVKSGAVTIRQELESLGAAHPEYPLHIFEVPRSMDDMTELMDRLDLGRLLDMGISGVAPNMYTGGLILTLLPGASPDEAKQAVTAAIRADVPLAIVHGREPELPG